jgi:hypothetical protein
MSVIQCRPRTTDPELRAIEKAEFEELMVEIEELARNRGRFIVPNDLRRPLCVSWWDCCTIH